MTVLEQAILATDLASYFEKREKFQTAADMGEIDWQAEDRKKLLSSMLMTAADVAAIAKPWELQHETAKQVADEFFDQGDMERMQLGINPMWMMDRERKDELPQMQVRMRYNWCCKTIHRFHNRLYNHGEGPSRGLLRDCTTSPINRFAALVTILDTLQHRIQFTLIAGEP